MTQRKGEKTGWIVGWLGGFLWLVLLSTVWLFRGKPINGVVGIILFLVAVLMVFVLAPWKHPKTAYWKLMLPIYVLFMAAVAMSIWFEGGVQRLGLSWRSILWLLPLFIPFATVGKRSWNDTGAVGSSGP
jgi:hypothetical protein